MNSSTHWLYQRLTGLLGLLAVPGVWYLGRHISLTYPILLVFLKSPLLLVIASFFVVALLYHAKLGICVILEDYAHGTHQKIGLALTNAVFFALLILYILSLFFLFKGA